MNLGIAYQIIDDVLDYTEDQSTIGKPAGNDLRQGMVTLPLIYALQEQPQNGHHQRVNHLLNGTTHQEEDIRTVVNWVIKSSGVKRAYVDAHYYANIARQGSQSLASETYIPRTMPQVLGTFDMIAIYVAAIFFIGNAALSAVAGGVVSLTYLAIAAVAFFLPCVIATTQLGVIYPHEGSLYNWTCRALGNYWGFFAGISYWLPNVLAIVGAADGFVTYIQGLNHDWLVAPCPH